MSRDEAPLPQWAERMLQSVPVPERDWEAQRSAIEARLADVPSGSTEGGLLEAPLPLEAPPTAGPKPPPAGSLSDLARQVAQRSSRKEAALVRDSLHVAASRRPRPAPGPVAVAVPPPAAAPPPAAVAPAPVVTPQRNRGVMPFLVGAGVALAAAASWVAITRPEAAPIPSVVESAAPIAAAPASADPAPSAASEGAAAAQEPASTATQAAPGTAPPVAPAAEETATRAPAAAAARPASGAVAAKPAASPRGAARKAGGAGPQERVVLEETPSPASSPRSPLLRPAAGLPGELPERPSSGAIQAALGSVMGSARACLAGATTPATATVVFGSDGRVVSVRVSGPLAGTPAGSCVETALARARVQPFSQATTSVGGIAVRP